LDANWHREGILGLERAEKVPSLALGEPSWSKRKEARERENFSVLKKGSAQGKNGNAPISGIAIRPGKGGGGKGNFQRETVSWRPAQGGRGPRGRGGGRLLLAGEGVPSRSLEKKKKQQPSRGKKVGLEIFD